MEELQEKLQIARTTRTNDFLSQILHFNAGSELPG